MCWRPVLSSVCSGVLSVLPSLRGVAATGAKSIRFGFSRLPCNVDKNGPKIVNRILVPVAAGYSGKRSCGYKQHSAIAEAWFSHQLTTVLFVDLLWRFVYYRGNTWVCVGVSRLLSSRDAPVGWRHFDYDVTQLWAQLRVLWFDLKSYFWSENWKISVVVIKECSLHTFYSVATAPLLRCSK